MDRIYIGVDASSSCTGITVINQDKKLIKGFHIYTLPLKRCCKRLGDIIYMLNDEYKKHITAELKDILLNNEIVGIACEGNSHSDYYGTMLLGTCNGLIIGRMLEIIGKQVPIHISSSWSWRNAIWKKDMELDLNVQSHRNYLKYSISDWYEETFKVKMPHWDKFSKEIQLPNGDYDQRINDISDAGGLAYALYLEYPIDRKEIKNNIKKETQRIKSLKSGVVKYKKLCQEWESRYEEESSKYALKTLEKHILSLKWYLAELKKKKKWLKTYDGIIIYTQKVEEKIKLWNNEKI